jgi:chorismate mutase/prephenate dehydratase
MNPEHARTAPDPLQLSFLREKIDAIDEKLLALLNARADCALRIGLCKPAEAAAVYDPAREAVLQRNLLEKNRGPLSSEALQVILSEIVSACRAVQQPVRIAFLGPVATYTHSAARRRFGSGCDYEPQTAIPDVFDAVEKGAADFGVVPMENSIEGGVGLTLDCLNRTPLKTVGEIFLRIRHGLLTREDDPAKIRMVYSHPQALSQCRDWLRRHLPEAHQIEAASTAAAAAEAGRNPGCAAVGSELAARRYGLKLLAQDIQDHPLNLTRFLVLGWTPCAKTGRDKTSLLFVTRHEPGALHRALTPFAEQAVNITRIESRPSRRHPWEYVFFVDLEGHDSDAHVGKALARMRAHVDYLKVLGGYPKGVDHAA